MIPGSGRPLRWKEESGIICAGKDVARKASAFVVIKLVEEVPYYDG